MSPAELGRRTRSFLWSVLAGMAWAWLVIADVLRWLADVIESQAAESRIACLRRARL